MKQMPRREWICCFACGSMGYLASPLSLAAPETAASLNSPPSIPEEELLGLKTPPLRGKNHRLRRLASEAFEKMRMAALQDGIRLYSVSSYRSFHSQKRIWNRKYRQYQKKGMNHQAIVETIIQYSSIPGTSRHHWGTDLDIIDESLPRPSDPLLPEHFLEGGIYHPLYLWLQKHAADYGFYEAYTHDAKRSGYAYEPWHWSFAFLSIPFLQQYQQIDLYRHLRQSDMEGHAKFTREFAERFKREWVGGVNPKLIPK